MREEQAHKTMIQSYYEVAALRRLLNIIGLFYKTALWKRVYSAKETYNFKEPTNRSHPISASKWHTSWGSESGESRGKSVRVNNPPPLCH